MKKKKSFVRSVEKFETPLPNFFFKFYAHQLNLEAIKQNKLVLQFHIKIIFKYSLGQAMHIQLPGCGNFNDFFSSFACQLYKYDFMIVKLLWAILMSIT